MLDALARAVWKDLIHGTRCRTMLHVNLLHAGEAEGIGFRHATNYCRAQKKTTWLIR